MLFEVSYLVLVCYANRSNFGKIASHWKLVDFELNGQNGFYSNFHERKPYLEKIITARLVSP